MSITNAFFTPDWLVYSGSNGIFYSKNTKNNVIVYSGSTFITVLQSTIDSGLTAGRTWKETIYCKAIATITNEITVPSYTRLILSGYYTLASGSADNLYIFRNPSFSTSYTDIDIIGDGATLDGNRAQQTSAQTTHYGIYMKRVTNCHVKNLTIKNWVYGAVELDSCNYSSIDGVTSTNNRHIGQAIVTASFAGLPSNGCNIRNGISYGEPDSNESAAFGIVGDPSAMIHDANIINCYSSGSGNQGFQIYSYSTGCFVIGCHALRFKTSGIVLGRGTSYEDTNLNIGAIGNTVDNDWNPAYDYPIGIVSTNNDVLIEGNTILNTQEGIDLSLNWCSRNIVRNNLIRNSKYGILVGNAAGAGAYSDNEISGNTISTGSNPNAYNSIAIWLLGTGSGNKISGNRSINNSFGIVVSGTNLANVIENNYITGSNANGAISGSSLIGNTVRNNIGYVTENNGTFNFSGISGSITHGLATTGSGLIVSLTSTGSASANYVLGLSWYPSGSTGFWIFQSGSGQIGGVWRASSY